MNYGLFQERLKNILKEKNLKIKDLAQKTNLYPDQISRWLNGIHLPKEETINIIANSLDINLEWLKGNYINETISFSLTLYELIRIKKISKEDLCVKLNIELKILDNWLSQKTIPSKENIDKICLFFQIKNEEDLFNSQTYNNIINEYRNNNTQHNENITIIKKGNITISIVDKINERDYLEINKILIDNLK